MTEPVASLVVEVDASGAKRAAVDLDTLAKAADRADVSANDLTDSARKLSAAEAAVANEAQRAMAGVSHLADEQDAAVKTANRLNAAHGTVINSSKILGQTTLNLGRQFSDVGVQLAGGQSPFLILIQQGPQIADAFAVAKQQGLGFKAVITGLVAEARPLIATFGPWVAGLAAVGGAVWLAVHAIDEHEKKVKALYKAIDEQNKKLSESAPWLVKSADNAALAAEGQKNFEAFLSRTNKTLKEHIALLRASAIEGYKTDLQEAQKNQKQAQTEFNRISTANGRGSSSMGFTTNVGGFSTVSEAPSRKAIEQTDKYKESLKKATEASDNVRIATEKLNKALGVKPDDYGVFAGQASQAEKLAGAIDNLLPKEKQIRDIRQQQAIVQQALAKGQIDGAKASRAMAEAEKQIADINKDPAAARAASAALRKERAEAKKELAELAKAYEEPLKASEQFADALAKEVAVMGLSSDEQKRREIAIQAATAPTKALADQITALGRVWEEHNRVGKEAAEVQARVKDAANDNIKTFSEATKGQVHFSSQLEIVAADLDEAARAGRDLRYDIEDIAHAINENDWTSAFAGLANVLAKVDTAFKTAKTSKDKFAAVAQLAQGVGGAIGGKGGAVVGGAGSGALAGLGVASSLTTLGLAIPGPGWALAAGGAVLGALGGLFGGGGAKKRQREQEAAQRAADEAQRVQTVADTSRQIEIDTLRASGNEIAAVALERKGELDALTKLDPALAASKQAYFDLVDAADKKAKADEKAAEIATRAGSIQDEIDKLTLSSTDLLAKTRARERAEAVALDPSLGDLIDKLYGLQDAATATADAVAQAEAAATAASEAYQEQARIAAYMDDKAASRVKEAQESYSNQLTGIADAATAAAHALDGAIKSLTDFADSLKSELGLGTTGGGLEQAKRAFNTAVATGNYDAIPDLGKAYADAAKSGAGSQTEYLRIIAQIRQASLNSATSAKSDAYQGSLTQMLLGALFQGSNTGDFSGLDEIRRLKAAGLPAAATGGSFTVGGNGGIDNNLLSINGVPTAAVNQGEQVFIEPAGRRPSNDNSEMAALRAEVAAARRENAELMRQLVDYAKTVARIAINITPDGDSAQVRNVS